MEGGQVIGKQIFGLARDYQSTPLMLGEDPLIYEKSDFDSKITFEDKAFTISVFDHDIGSVYLTEYDTRRKKFIDTVALDLASVAGITSPSKTVPTAWNSTLFSEGTPVNSANPDSFIDTFKHYYKNKADLVNPYNYGWVTEIVLLDNNGSAKAIKNYAVGRVSASQLVLMPDGKTLYLFDSENSGHLYMFVAAETNSLTKGTLYIAEDNDGKVNFVELGSTSALKAKFKLKRAKFKTFFDIQDPKSTVCTTGFKLVKTEFGAECLKLKSKNKKYAGIFEPQRVAALKGIKPFGFPSSTDSSALEMGFNQDSKVIYFASQQGAKYEYAVTENTTLNSSYAMEQLR